MTKGRAGRGKQTQVERGRERERERETDRQAESVGRQVDTDGPRDRYRKIEEREAE